MSMTLGDFSIVTGKDLGQSRKSLESSESSPLTLQVLDLKCVKNTFFNVIYLLFLYT